MFLCIPHQSLMMRQSGKWTNPHLKNAVSADGDGKHCSGVDDFASNEPPSQVLALTSRCHMWLHVGV